MESNDEEAERAICSLLDDIGAPESPRWLSPRDDAVEASAPGAGAVRGALPSPAPLATVSDTAITNPRRRTNGARPRAKQKDPNRARREQWIELLHLRRQAAELERHIGSMRSGDAGSWSSLPPIGSLARPRPTLRIVENLYPTASPRNTWKNLAINQQMKRLAAETENTRLRTLVNSNVEIGNRLRRILTRKRLSPLSSDLEAGMDDRGAEPGLREFSPAVIAPPTTSVTTDFSLISFTGGPAMPSAEVFGVLKDAVTRAWENMDVLFASNGLIASDKTFQSARVEQIDARKTSMELAASKALPFDLESTARVAWRHFVDLHPKMPDRASFQFRDSQKYVELEGEEGMLAATYTSELENGFVRGKFDEWRVVKQFVGPNRVVIICCIVSEATEFASKPVSGIRTLKEIYIVLRRPARCRTEAGATASQDTTTVMQTFYRFQPAQYKSTPGLENTLAAVTDFMFGFIGGRIGLNYQMIEQELRSNVLS